MVTDAQIGIAMEAFDQKAGYSKIEKMRAALEAALTAAEPSGEAAGQQGRYWMANEGRWSNWFDITFNTWVPEPGVREVRNLYAAPPAPSVAVKALEWETDTLMWTRDDGVELPASNYWTAKHHVIGLLPGWEISRFVDERFPKVTRSFVLRSGRNEKEFATLDEAKAAAQADYEGRIRSALSAQVQDVAEERTETCQRCQGNGEIVTDWERYRHPHKNDVGDEAVAECPDCNGIGKITAQEGWQFVPKEPTDDMIEAFRQAHARKCVDIASPTPTEHPDDGGGPIGYGYRAMLAAAPAKQEG